VTDGGSSLEENGSCSHGAEEKRLKFQVPTKFCHSKLRANSDSRADCVRRFEYVVDL
jgi:hypothetical protein